MKIGIIISDNDAEKCWNAFRFGNFCLGQRDEVKIFLMGKGVEYEKTLNVKFNTIEQAEIFLSEGGEIFACGTMKDAYDIVVGSDKVVCF
jgi:uncharacterized protein involved in oxidation of intracellular sulfur